MKTILVPTDFSKNSLNALDYAMALAKREKAKITLVHAFFITYIAPDVPVQYLAEELVFTEDAAIKQMNELIEKVEAENLKCDYIIEQNGAIELILEVAKKTKPDFIIMGTKGASGIKEIFMGSNTATVIEKAKCPVIAVPEKSKYSPIKHIAYATNYLQSDMDAIKNLVNLAELFQADITLLHVSDEQLSHETEEAHIVKFRNIIKSKTSYDKVRYKLIYGKNLGEVLEKYINNTSPDLLSMSTHYRNIYDKLFGKSNTKKMAYHIHIPLLAFHYKQEPVIFI